MKRKIMTGMILITSALLSGYVVPDLQATANDWTILGTKNGIEVHYRLARCGETQRILFMVQNFNQVSNTVDFECRVTAGGQEILFPSLINSVAANEALQGECADDASRSTFIEIPDGVLIESVTIAFKS